jgi:ABC-type branched-subunit amino acid transport system ATPase component
LTILIVEHDMQVVMELAQRITVLHYGEILAEGTPAEIQQNTRVLEVYLKT